jgi:hypothetical protein
MVTTMLVVWAVLGGIGVGVGVLTGSVGWGLVSVVLACPLLWVAMVVAFAASAGWAPTREALATVSDITSKAMRRSHDRFFPRLPPRG